MTLINLFLVFISAALHAGWNLLGRGQKTNALWLFRRMLVVMVLAAAPLVLLAVVTGGLPGLPGMIFAAVSGVICAGNYFCVSRAYRYADVSAAYPLARSLPVIALALWDAVRGRIPTAGGWLGLLLVSVGCVAVSWRELGALKGAKGRQALLWPALTAVTVILYTMVDKTAAEFIPRGLDSALVYNYVLYAFSLIALLLLMRSPVMSGPVPHGLGWKRPVMGAAFDFTSYWIILFVYQSVGRASYVIAFRQVSVVLAVLGAFWLYPEERAWYRLPAVVLIAAGLILIAWMG